LESLGKIRVRQEFCPVRDRVCAALRQKLCATLTREACIRKIDAVVKRAQLLMPALARAVSHLNVSQSELVQVLENERIDLVRIELFDVVEYDLRRELHTEPLCADLTHHR